MNKKKEIDKEKEQKPKWSSCVSWMLRVNRFVVFLNHLFYFKSSNEHVH